MLSLQDLSGFAGLLNQGAPAAALLSHDNTVLFPAAATGRIIQRLTGSSRHTTLTIPPSPIKNFLTSVVSFGLSLIIIAQVKVIPAVEVFD